MDRFRSMPMARLAVPFGPDPGLASGLVIVGWRINGGPAQAIAPFGDLALQPQQVKPS